MVKKYKMSNLDWIAIVLLVVGGLNWGLVGILDFNLVTWLLGTGAIIDWIYGLVGASAIYTIFKFLK